jgi:hypothetical protein
VQSDRLTSASELSMMIHPSIANPVVSTDVISPVTNIMNVFRCTTNHVIPREIIDKAISKDATRVKDIMGEEKSQSISVASRVQLSPFIAIRVAWLEPIMSRLYRNEPARTIPCPVHFKIPIFPKITEHALPKVNIHVPQIYGTRGFDVRFMGHETLFNANLYELEHNAVPKDALLTLFFTDDVVSVLGHNIDRYLTDHEDWSPQIQQTIILDEQSNVHLMFNNNDSTYWTTPEIFRQDILPEIIRRLSKVYAPYARQDDYKRCLEECLYVKVHDDENGYKSCFHINFCLFGK